MRLKWEWLDASEQQARLYVVESNETLCVGNLRYITRKIAELLPYMMTEADVWDKAVREVFGEEKSEAIAKV